MNLSVFKIDYVFFSLKIKIEKNMFRLSSLLMELNATVLFSSLESLDYQAINKDHLGDI
jgi:hypothetical protein